MIREYDLHSIKDELVKYIQLLPESSLSQIREALEHSINKIDEPMQLAIIGKISSSKSTLVNAILGKEELMQTGQKEVTYNVGWLKYGPKDSEIIIHYKDGTSPIHRSKTDFFNLSIYSQKKEIDNILYIELFDDAEILKDINIIDTPGLDALRGKDSQNTLDFINKVRPDAVIMLFTHSIAENTIDVVKEFNIGTTLNPLNAIGILSKIDILWQESIPKDKSALSIGKKMVLNRMTKNPVLQKTLFNLYPISALLFMAASTITQNEIDNIVYSFNSSPDTFCKSLNSVQKFLNENTIDMHPKARSKLINTLGIYGIYLIVEQIKQGLSTDLDEIKNVFIRESGGDQLLKILRNHFANRSKLIKLESIYQHLQQTIIYNKVKINDSSRINLLIDIEQKLSDLFSSLVHEHIEYELLNKIYTGSLMLDEEVKKEICLLCGEQGDSAPERLGMPIGSDINSLINKSLQREMYWRKEIALEPDPEERDWMKVLLKSYSILRKQISLNAYQYEQSKAFLFNQ